MWIRHEKGLLPPPEVNFTQEVTSEKFRLEESCVRTSPAAEECLSATTWFRELATTQPLPVPWELEWKFEHWSSFSVEVDDNPRPSQTSHSAQEYARSVP
jgi:hypothetical protein